MDHGVSRDHVEEVEVEDKFYRSLTSYLCYRSLHEMVSKLGYRLLYIHTCYVTAPVFILQITITIHAPSKVTLVMLILKPVFVLKKDISIDEL